MTRPQAQEWNISCYDLCWKFSFKWTFFGRIQLSWICYFHSWTLGCFDILWWCSVEFIWLLFFRTKERVNPFAFPMIRCLHQVDAFHFLLGSRLQLSYIIFNCWPHWCRRLRCECYYSSRIAGFFQLPLIKQVHTMWGKWIPLPHLQFPHFAFRWLFCRVFFLPLSGEVRFGGLSLGPTQAKLVNCTVGVGCFWKKTALPFLKKRSNFSIFFI